MSKYDTLRQIDPADSFSPLTKLRSRTLYGRPDFHSFFANLATSIDNGSYLPGREARLKNRVGVYYCGVSLSSFQLSRRRNS